MGHMDNRAHGAIVNKGYGQWGYRGQWVKGCGVQGVWAHGQ